MVRDIDVDACHFYYGLIEYIIIFLECLNELSLMLSIKSGDDPKNLLKILCS